LSTSDEKRKLAARKREWIRRDEAFVKARLRSGDSLPICALLPDSFTGVTTSDILVEVWIVEYKVEF
jgi:hypothetical protein